MMLLFAAVMFVSFVMTSSVPLSDYHKSSIPDIEKTLQLTLDFINIVKNSAFSESSPIYYTNETTYDSSNFPATKFRPSNCAEIQLKGFRKSGVYQVYPKGREELPSFEVYCDLHTEGGGWTVFQRRDDFGEPRENFFRNWTDYKSGFGNLSKEFWLGNDWISLLTTQDRMLLRVEIEDFEEESRYAHYTDFLVEAEPNLYNMSFRYYSGTAGDSLALHNGKTFVTLDRDVSSYAASYKGGWWYKGHYSNLNGLYQRESGVTNTACVSWYYYKSKYMCLKRAEMKIRPLYFVIKEFMEENA